MKAWGGKDENIDKAKQVLFERAKANGEVIDFYYCGCIYVRDY